MAVECCEEASHALLCILACFGCKHHADRFKLEPSRSPGPKYWLPGATGKQVNSTKPTRPIVGFGTGTRDGALKQYGVWSA